MASQWRSSSKARAAKLGIELTLPSIDCVHQHLLAVPKVCDYCGVRFSRLKKTRMNMDHRFPISRGGSAEVANLALCCRACNAAKGPLSEQEFRELLAVIGTWEDAGNSLLVRLRGGYWCYRPLTPPKIEMSCIGRESRFTVLSSEVN
jgi:5-methylcytosine-specific restriction endonuclease McrA